MSCEVLMLVDVLVCEKNVDKDVVLGVFEVVFVFVFKKLFDEGVEICVYIDCESGEYEIFCCWFVVFDEVGLQELDCEILLFEVCEQKFDVEVGEYVEEFVLLIEFGCIGVQVVKQVILQKVCDVECEQILNDYFECGEKIMMGMVKCFDKGNFIVELGCVEVLLCCDQLILKENLCVGDCVCVYIVKVDCIVCGLQIELLCMVFEFLMKLFEMEVLEIEQGLFEIKVVVCDLGVCVKIGVIVYDKWIDLIGICVGICGL